MGEMTSAAVPALGAADHVDGEGREAIVYVDLGCPHCAAVWGRIRALPLRLCFRHFPMRVQAPAVAGAARRRRGRRAPGRLLADGRLALRRPGAGRRPASVGAGRALRPRSRPLPGRQPLGGRRGARAPRLRERRRGPASPARRPRSPAAARSAARSSRVSPGWPRARLAPRRRLGRVAGAISPLPCDALENESSEAERAATGRHEGNNTYEYVRSEPGLGRQVGGDEISFETGKLAKQASGSVVVRSGDTMVLCTATNGQ